MDAESQHRRALKGLALAKCKHCDGGRRVDDGYDDGYGRWVEPRCHHCAGLGYVEVPCSPDVEAAAVEEEIKRLKTRLRELKKKGRARDGR